MSIHTSVIAKLVGEYALAAIMLVVGIFGVPSLPLPLWLKISLLVPAVGAPAFLVVAAALGRLYGGETGMEIVDGQRRFSVVGFRFADLAAVMRQGQVWYRRTPMMRPSGRVLGNPANPTDVREDATAGLPETVETAEQPVEVPPDAASLETGGGHTAS